MLNIKRFIQFWKELLCMAVLLCRDYKRFSPVIVLQTMVVFSITFWRFKRSKSLMCKMFSSEVNN